MANNYYNGKCTIEQLVTGSFVKYNRLRDLIGMSFRGSKATNLNIFIDLYSILKPLYSIDQWSYRYDNILELSSTIINMCGHYRTFFRNMGVYSKFYIIYGLNAPELNNSFVTGYNNLFISSYTKKQDINKMVRSNIEALDMICQYLPGIYFYNIGTNEICGMIARILRSLNDPNSESIVITKDIVALELVPEYNVRILRPVKREEDESFIVDNSNLWDMFMVNYRRCKTPDIKIGTGFIQNLLPITRVPERGMKSVLNIPQAYNIFVKGLEFKFLDNSKLYSQTSINSVIESLGINCNPTLLEMRYKAINPTFQGLFILTNSNPEFRTINFTDLEDTKSLHYIINQYYSNVPIDIDKL